MDEFEVEKLLARYAKQQEALGKFSDERSVAKNAADRLKALNNPTLEAFRKLEDSPHMRMLKSLQQNSVFDELKRMSENPTIVALRELESNPAIELQKKLSEIHTKVGFPLLDTEMMRSIRRTQNSLQITGVRSELFSPESSMAQGIANEISNIVRPPTISGVSELDWPQRLEGVVQRIESPWVAEAYAGLSLQGVGVLTRVGDIARFSEPFSDQQRDQLDEDLGDPVEVSEDASEDEATLLHIEAGMNPGLASIEVPQSRDILLATGFILPSRFAPLLNPIDASSGDLIFDPSFGEIIRYVESNLRNFIDNKMKAEHGSDWVKSKVSGNKRDEWKLRRDKAISDGEPPYALLYYSDLIDLKDIIVGRSAWQNIFSPYFKIQAHFITSMDRLYAVRKPISHSRPLCKEHRLQLHFEATIVLRAIGVQLLAS